MSFIRFTSYKLVIYEFSSIARVFVPGKLFQPNPTKHWPSTKMSKLGEENFMTVTSG
jgi:hypothetical protein